MPRPPTLKPIDWKLIFESGRPFPEWLAAAELPEKARQMEAELGALVLEPQIQGYLGSLPRRLRVVAIAEDWCGDVVRHVPVLRKLEEAAPALELRFITREQWPEVFVRFLTNGGEAIPQFIFLSEAWVECAHWGPMPAACRELIARGKALGDPTGARQRVAALYEADPRRLQVVRELVQCVDIASATEL